MSVRSTRRAGILSLALVSFLGPLGFADTLDVARQNPILRDHFLQLYLNTRVYPPFGEGSYRADLRFLEGYVDRSIEDYLKRVNERLGSLKAHMSDVQRARRELRAASEDERGKAGRRWIASLKEVSDQAESLRKMIANVLGGLDRKNNFRIEMSDNARVTTYLEEIQFMEEQILKAEQRIQDYFFVPTHVVQVEDLKGENMMIYLYRVRKMAERLRKGYPSG